MPTNRQYARRDIVQLDEEGDYYIRHASAMTAERLHAKSDIAAELGWRDREIARLRDVALALRQHLSLFCGPSDSVARDLFEAADKVINRAELENRP